MSGIMIGAGLRGALSRARAEERPVNVTNTNGLVSVKGLAGQVIAHTTNGGVKGAGLSGGVDARTTNGGVTIDMASLGVDPSSWRRPMAASRWRCRRRRRPTVTASCTNGGISVGSLDNFEVSEKSRRRLEGKLNGGGANVELHTTNGGVACDRAKSINTRTDTDTTDERKDRRREPLCVRALRVSSAG